MVDTFQNIIDIASSQVESIPNIKSSTNFWMIRSKKGIFYSEFLDGNFIAIGWNALSTGNLSQDDEALKKNLPNIGYKDKMPGTALNKCRRFVDEVKEGDIAMIVGRDEIAFAYIGDYYEYDHTSTTVEKELEVITQIDNGIYMGDYCPYKKRRHITIINKIRIDIVSPSIYKCLVANRHSLSNLNDYADAIISASYDVAYYNNRLIVKYHIGQPRDINPFDFSRFTLSAVSLLAEDEKNVIGKYNINSEGDVVLFLVNAGKDIYEFIRDNIATIWVIYAIVFGGKGLGFEIPSAIDKCKSWVTDLLCWKETRRLQKASADKTEAEVEKIQAETEQIKLKTEIDKLTLEKMRQEKAVEAEQIVNLLQATSTPLSIQPPSKKIISLVDFLNKESKK